MNLSRFEMTLNYFLSDFHANQWNYGFRNKHIIHHIQDPETEDPNNESCATKLKLEIGAILKTLMVVQLILLMQLALKNQII